MIPQHFVELDSLPTLANGKVDRVRLSEFDPRTFVEDGDSAPPTTPTEHLIAAIWREVLEDERLSVHDTFYDLGGDSLLGVRVMRAITERAGVRFHPTDLVSEPWVSSPPTSIVATVREPSPGRRNRDVSELGDFWRRWPVGPDGRTVSGGRDTPVALTQQ